MTRWYHIQSLGSSCPSYSPGKYTAEEIDDMVFVDGYIPVASADEFDAIRSGASETMGAGTCWEDTYTTGVNKKYVQVTPIDFTAFGTWDTNLGTVGGSFAYDGNELLISNLNATDSLIGFLNYNSKFSNTRISGSLTATSGARGLVASVIYPHANTDYSNNVVNATIHITTTNNSVVGGHIGSWGGSWSGGDIDLHGNVLIGSLTVVHGGSTIYVGGIFGGGNQYTGKNIYQNVNYATITGTGNVACSGIVGHSGSIRNINIYDCENHGDITAGLNATGIIGSAYGGGGTKSVYDCVNYGDITGGRHVAGVVGSYVSSVHRCVNNGNVQSTSGTSNMVGGVAYGTNLISMTECVNNGNVSGVGYVGGVIASGVNSNQLEDCASYGHVTGHASRTGGLCGNSQASFVAYNSFAAVTSDGSCKGVNGVNNGTYYNCYWDTTLNATASTKGTGKTTSELQTPTTNSGIYSAWTIPPWEFGTSTDYPKLNT